MPHPHMRGEYFHTSHPGMCAAGSSPRAWGIRSDSCHKLLVNRFIPTCVGNTPAQIRGHAFKMVHPHVRGEYFGKAPLHGTQFGSSPRAWGIQIGHHVIADDDRFIPTCVGNTVPGNRDERLDPVHPHVRGEYAQLAIAQRSRYGSSPRAWGIPQVFTVARKARRFIPTCVGNTRSARTAALTWTVHPHVRGEYPVLPVGIDTVDGSSPRAWGIRLSYIDAHIEIRFIPTCVGNTLAGPSLLRLYPVHPHMRGEYAA